jgi:hypothetical protein
LRRTAGLVDAMFGRSSARPFVRSGCGLLDC